LVEALVGQRPGKAEWSVITNVDTVSRRSLSGDIGYGTDSNGTEAAKILAFAMASACSGESISVRRQEHAPL